MSALPPADECVEDLPADAPVETYADGTHWWQICGCTTCRLKQRRAYSPLPQRGITGRELALVQLQGVLKNTGWMATCARHACIEAGDADLAAYLQKLEDGLARSERRILDEAFPLNPEVRT